MKLGPKTIGYVAVGMLILVPVIWLLTKVARTETADVRLIAIGAVVAATIVITALSMVRLRSGSSNQDDDPAS